MTPQEQRQAEQARALFYAAMVAYGASAVQDSKSMWEDVPPVPGALTAVTTARWLAAAVEYVRRQRVSMQALALAYYRYERALNTGRTISLPGAENPPYVPLRELRAQFEALVPGAPSQAVRDEPGAPDDVIDVADDDSDIDIPVETIDGLEDELADLESQALEEVRAALINTGPRIQDKKIREAEPAGQLADVVDLDSRRKKAHDEAGNRQASVTEMAVMNGARGALFQIADRDREALGFIRVSSTGTPCGFCAMLISRGPVLKSSGRQASLYASNSGTGPQPDGEIVTYGDLDLYHPNCHCYALPIFSVQQYATSSMFELNREYAEAWPKVTKGLGGRDALNAWRAYIRNQQAESRKPQEAAA